MCERPYHRHRESMPWREINALLAAYGIESAHAATVLIRPGQPLLVEVAQLDDNGKHVRVCDEPECTTRKTEWREFNYTPASDPSSFEEENPDG